MTKQFKPLLSATVKDVSDLEGKWPLIASAKLDGIRVLIKDGVAVSRTLKPIRNKYVQSILGVPALEGLDGEIIVGSSTDDDAFRNTTSGVMSEDGEPDFTFFVFDKYDVDDPFVLRLSKAGEIIDGANVPNVVTLPHKLVFNAVELEAFEKECLELGFEGVMLRKPLGDYKYGRSTLKEGILMKVKQFVDSEARIVGFVERMHNANEATTDNLGHTERSSHKENLVGRGDLGALNVVDIHTGVEFDIGTGFTDEVRAFIWENKESFLGKIVKYKYFPVGIKDKPRHPVFLGVRAEEDIVNG